MEAVSWWRNAQRGSGYQVCQGMCIIEENICSGKEVTERKTLYKEAHEVVALKCVKVRVLLKKIFIRKRKLHKGKHWKRTHNCWKKLVSWKKSVGRSQLEEVSKEEVSKGVKK